MHENTNSVYGGYKRKAGEYVTGTYGGREYGQSGQFIFRKTGSKWIVSHIDFTVEGFPHNAPERTYAQAQPTLKAAQEFAERIVRDLPNNVAKRREAALKGAMPVVPTRKPVENAAEAQMAADAAADAEAERRYNRGRSQLQMDNADYERAVMPREI